MDTPTRTPKIRQRQVNVLGKTAKNKKKRQERVRLDETVKLLFEVSKELLVKTSTGRKRYRFTTLTK